MLHHPRIGLKAGQQIASVQKGAAVGIADFDGLPAGVAADLREGGPDLTLSDATALFTKLRSKADPAEIALATRAGAIAHRALQAPERGPLNAMIAAAEREARLRGAEEIYLAAAPDLTRGARFMRIEGETSAGKFFALRATVAYKGAWVRLVRAFYDPEIAQKAAAQFAQAVAQLPSDRGFAGFGSFIVEGCRVAQPLEPLLGSQFEAANPAVAWCACLGAGHAHRRWRERSGRRTGPHRSAGRSGEPLDRPAVRLGIERLRKTERIGPLPAYFAPVHSDGTLWLVRRWNPRKRALGIWGPRRDHLPSDTGRGLRWEWQR